MLVTENFFTCFTYIRTFVQLYILQWLKILSKKYFTEIGDCTHSQNLHNKP